MSQWVFKKGQSAGEYALVGGLVLLVSLGGLSSLSGVFNTKLSEISNTYSVPKNSSVSGFGIAPSGGYLAAHSSGLGSTSLPSNPSAGTGNVTLTLANGKTLQIPSFTTNPAQIVEIAGASGATDSLALSLKQLAKTLVDAGEMTPTQSQALIELANKGHNIAQFQKALEEASASAPDNMPFSEFKNKTVVIDGKTYTMEELGGSIVLVGDDLGRLNGGKENFEDYSSIDELYNSYQQYAQQLDYYKDDPPRQMLNQYMKIKNSGGLSDPTVQQVVTSLVSSIFKVSDTFERAASGITYYNSDPNTSMGELRIGSGFDTVNQTLKASLNNNQSSAGICYTGNGSDSGVKCQ